MINNKINKDIKYKEEFLYPLNIHLNVTDACNLACKYCFVQHKPNYMNLDTAIKIVDWMYNNYNYHNKHKTLYRYNDHGKCNLSFFGGEPTLCYDTIIKPVVEYCNAKYPGIFEYGITTNGTLLDKEKIDFFRQNNFNILFSIDGPPEVQDYNRPCKNPNLKSSQLIQKNLNYLLQQFPNLPFRQTVYIDTVDKMFEGYKYAEKLGFNNWVFVIDKIHPFVWTPEKKEILKDQINHIYYYRLLQLEQNILPMKTPRMDLSMWSTMQILKIKSDETGEYIKNLFPRICGVGMSSAAIGYNGDIFTCQEQVTQNDNDNIFKIGNIYLKDKINKEKQQYIFERFIQEFKKMELNNNKCQNCDLKVLCEGGVYCPSTSYMLHDSLAPVPEDIECFEKQIHFYNNILLFQILLNIDNEAVQKYFSNQLATLGSY